jgi:hypothetical protein
MPSRRSCRMVKPKIAGNLSSTARTYMRGAEHTNRDVVRDATHELADQAAEKQADDRHRHLEARH